MKKFQADMKDVSAKKWRRDRLMKKVSSVFKGCKHCGEWEMRLSKTTGKMYKHWYLPGEVYQAYTPTDQGWSHWCYQCGAKNGDAWGEPQALELKSDLKWEREQKIASLEEQLDDLMAKLKGIK